MFYNLILVIAPKKNGCTEYIGLYVNSLLSVLAPNIAYQSGFLRRRFIPSAIITAVHSKDVQTAGIITEKAFQDSIGEFYAHQSSPWYNVTPIFLFLFFKKHMNSALYNVTMRQEMGHKHMYSECEKYWHTWGSEFIHSDTGSGDFTSFPLVSPFSIHSTVTLSLSSCNDVTIAWCIRPAERGEMLCLLCAARDSATLGSRPKTNLGQYHLKIRSHRKTPTLHQHLTFYDSCRESWPLKYGCRDANGCGTW